jgi:hypothetical protein
MTPELYVQLACVMYGECDKEVAVFDEIRKSRRLQNM